MLAGLFAWFIRRRLRLGADGLPTTLTSQELLLAITRQLQETLKPLGDCAILDWKIEVDNRLLVVESCLVLCRVSVQSQQRWLLASLFRHPRKENSAWAISGMQMLLEDMTDAFHWGYQIYEERPGNREVSEFRQQQKLMHPDSGFVEIAGGSPGRAVPPRQEPTDKR